MSTQNKEPTMCAPKNNPAAKALELPSYRQQVIGNKKAYTRKNYKPENA